jgi:hypothetical protein
MLRRLIWAATLPIMAACAGPAASGEPSLTPSPEQSLDLVSELPAGETITGILGADSIEGGCAYLESADGTRYEVLYPEGWTLDRSSAELTAPDGTVRARAGDEVTVRGSLASDVGSFCQIGPIFRASELVEP